MVGPTFEHAAIVWQYIDVLSDYNVSSTTYLYFVVQVLKFFSSLVTYVAGMRSWAPKILWFTFLLDYYLETIKNVLFSGPTIFPNVFQVGPEKMKVISTKSSPPGFLKGIFQSFPEEGYQPSTTGLNIIHD